MVNKSKRSRKHFLLINIIDKLSFVKIFIIWILIIFIFAFIYQIMGSVSSGLEYNSGNKVTGLANFVYYSFITATSTGYGDIVPTSTGMRLLAITNVIIGLLMMAVVTSKLVSMKQEKLLEQIYHLSFSEKVSRVLSGLTLFKGEAEKISYKLKKHEIVNRKTLFSLKMSLSTLKSNMLDIKDRLIQKEYLLKRLESSQIELIISGLSQVFDEILTIIECLEKNEVSFKNPMILEEIYNISNIGTQLIYKAREEFPILNDRTSHVIHTINAINKRIMHFKIVDIHNDIEINISPEISVK